MALRQKPRWADLPCELVMEHVLVCLPLPKIFEFRIVCRSWAAHLSSPTFLDAWSAHSVRWDEEECLVMAQYSEDWLQGRLSDKTLVAYFPSLRRYVNLPLHANIRILGRSPAEAVSVQGMSITSHINSSLPKCEALRILDFRSVSVKTMASAGGLICTTMYKHDCFGEFGRVRLGRNIRRHYTVLVFNPLNGSLKVLPSPIRQSSGVTSTHILVHSDLLSYKVFIHFKDAHSPSLQVYDSLEESWTLIESPSVVLCFSHAIMHADLHFWNNARKTIYGYHAHTGLWSTAYFNTEGKGLFSLNDCTWSANFESPCIMAYNGRLIFALIIRKIPVDNQKTHLFGFIVYELQVPTDRDYPLHWKMIARTPEQMLEENCFYKESMSFFREPRVHLVHNKKLICMVCSCTEREFHGGGRFTRSAKQFLNPIAYDLENDKWVHIPSYKGRQDMAGLFSCKLSFNSFP